jgi:hypothetical protein
MDDNSKTSANFDQAMNVWTVTLSIFAETIKGYYDQHQAVKACDCSLCKKAEWAFRATEGK